MKRTPVGDATFLANAHCHHVKSAKTVSFDDTYQKSSLKTQWRFGSEVSLRVLIARDIS